jgi:hypothetical protein
VNIAPKAGRGWVQVAGPPLSENAFRYATLLLDPELVARHARERAAAIADRDRRLPPPLIGPHDPPVNLVGGYKFPAVPEIDPGPPAYPTSRIGSAHEIPADLSIPDFLRRGAAPLSNADDGGEP